MKPACIGKVIALTLILTLTGIQYKATNKDCDLILVNCDFFNKYETDDPGLWKVESRTCFDGTRTLPTTTTSTTTTTTTTTMTTGWG